MINDSLIELTETVNNLNKLKIDLVLEQIKTSSNEETWYFYNEEFDPGSGW